MPRAFVAMPFAQKFYAVYKAIRDACETLGVTSIRIDEVWARDDIYKQIEEEILKADFLIADFTGDRMLEVPNPNVVHEATFARVNKKYLILLAQDHKCLPFDWRTRPAIIYNQTGEGLTYLKERLINAIQALKQKEDFGKDIAVFSAGASAVPSPALIPQAPFSQGNMPYPQMAQNFGNPTMNAQGGPFPFPTGYPNQNTAGPSTAAQIMENLVRSREGQIAPIMPPKIELPEGFKKEKGSVICQSDGSPMVWIKGGKFKMGGEEDDEQGPVHEVTLSDYLMDLYPVTNDRYAKFIQAGGYSQQTYWTSQGWNWQRRYNITRPAFWEDPNLNAPRQPVVGVSWYESAAYAAWAGKHLPTEAQWEYAARGKDQRHYPWGNKKPTKKLANYRTKNGAPALLEVGECKEGVSVQGCYAMAGGVWEWCYDWFGENYYAASLPCNPAGPMEGKERSCRGGAWTYEVDTLKTYYRFNGKPTLRDKGYGFRCARFF